MSDDPEPTVYVIAGPNGAGKTTFAQRYLPRFVDCREFVNADLIAAGLSPFHPESQSVPASRLFLQRIEDLASRSVSFSFETTLSGRAHHRRLRNLKNQRNYRVVIFFLWLPSEDMAVSRARTRVAQGGHDIPEPTIRRRFKKGIENFANLYRQTADEYTLVNAASWPPIRACSVSDGSVRIHDDASYNLLRGSRPEFFQ